MGVSAGQGSATSAKVEPAAVADSMEEGSRGEEQPPPSVGPAFKEAAELLKAVEAIPAVRTLANQRKAARQAGDDAEAEAIRQQLLELRETRPTEQDVVAVLTEEQRAELRKNRPFTLGGRSPQRRAPPAQDADAAPPPS